MNFMPNAADSSSSRGERDDYYQILDVSPDADVKTVKAGYRKLLRRLHPDMGDGDGTDNEFAYLISVVTQAKDVLTDPVRRAAYDERLGLSVQQVQEAVAQSREEEDYSTLVERVQIHVPEGLKVAWWRDGRVVGLAKKIGLVLGLLLAVVSGVTVYGLGWGWLFVLFPFLSLWWGYSRYFTKFNIGTWVLGVSVSAWVFLRGDNFGMESLSSLGLVWALWGLVMGVILSAKHVLVIPKKRVWNYGLGMPSAHASATGALVEKVSVLPGAMVVHGLSVNVDGRVMDCDHAIICGKKVAFVNSVEVNAGTVRWDSSGRSVVNNERDFINTDAAVVGHLLKDKHLTKLAEIEEFVFCHARNGEVQVSSTQGLPVLVDADSGVDVLVQWLMQDNDCAISSKKVVESVWRNVR